MAVTQEQVQKLALMARLELTAEQVATIAPQLDGIVNFVDTLMQLDTQGVEPMVHALESENRWADDILGTSLSRQAALANAPHRDDECFLVPPVL